MQSTPERLLALLEEHGLTEYAADVTSLLRPSIAMFSSEIADEQQIAIGASKLGGLPDFPPDMQWPYYHDRPLYFVAQINFADVAAYDIERVLPSSGIAYFFYDYLWYTETLMPMHEYGKVLFFDGALSLLKGTDAPYSVVWPSCTVSFKNDITLPESWEWFDKSKAYIRISKQAHYSDIQKKTSIFGEIKLPAHRLLGYPDPVQGYVFGEAQQQLDEQNFWKDADKLMETWTLLLQIDSDGKANMMWGDAGTLYFCIKNDALHKRHFDEVILIFQCG